MNTCPKNQHYCPLHYENNANGIVIWKNPSQSIFNKNISDTESTSQTSLSEIRSKASKLIKEQRVRDKEAYDKYRKSVEFKEGDLV